MSNTFKSLLVSLAFVSLMAGCSSTQKADEAAAAAEEARLAAEQAALDAQAEAERLAALEAQRLQEEADRINANVDTVFYFDFDQSILNSATRSALLVHAQRLKNTGESVRLEGHADERGSREYNMALGERRANAVRDFLTLQGVSSSRIETVSYGEEKPAEVGSYDSAWGKNRRVELK